MPDGSRPPAPPPTSPGTIAPDLTLDSPPAGRTFRRRRLGLLTGLLAATVAVGGLAGGDGDPDTSLVAGGMPGTAAEVGAVVGQSGGSVTLAAVFEQTTDTLLAATTTTLAGTRPTAATPPAPGPGAPPSTTSTTAGPATSSTSAARTSPSTTAPPASTAPPTTAPPSTAPPSTAPPSTAPPATAGPTSGGSGYDDPNTLQVWLDLARCESGGNWSSNTGNGYYGGLQFSLGTWQSVGGTGYPHEHGRDTQIEMGRRLQASAGWGAWPHCSRELGLR